MACHTVGGIKNDIIPLTETYTFMGIKALLTGQGTHRKYMPPFVGNEQEKNALATYIVAGINGKEIVTEFKKI